MATSEEIENVRKSANIVDIISSYVPLTQKGKNYFGVCPFHEDHSPSMSVSEEKQIYKCFSCGAAGNVFTFVSDYENVSFIEAVKIVALKCGIAFKGGEVTKKPKAFIREYEMMALALKFYQNNLNTKEGIYAKEYLSKRNLLENVIKDFDLGLALGKDYSLHQFLSSKNYTIEEMQNLGLVSENNSYLHDIFQYRIMFPIHDIMGNVVGFTGRIYDNSDQAKYMNSKESVIFKKGQILFNYHRAKTEIKKRKEVIIVEGNMDAIRMYSSGIKNVVALMGTSLTDEQVNIIKSMKAKVVLLLDNDNAGEIGTYQNGTILEDRGITPFVVRLTEEKDPDEYIIHRGVDALIKNIENPLSFLDFKLKYFKKNRDLSKVDDLASYIKDIIKDLKKIPDEITRELTLKKISDEYEISLDLLKKEVAKDKEVVVVKSLPKKMVKVPISRVDKACQNLIYFMMNDGKFIDIWEKEMGYFSNKVYRNIVNEIIYFYKNNQKMDISQFISFISEKEYIYDDAMEIIKTNKTTEFSDEAFYECLKSAKREMAKEEIKNIKRQIANTTDVNEEMKLAEKLLKLKKGCVGNE